ncbi:MAG TPA: RNA-binding protein [Thermoanaerobaculaceae bacterium]|nr:RNA-binding protein [Thermoanaerobaculaceae bacterium]
MKLYIGNLPFTTGDDELRELFSEYGTVASARVIIDNTSGRSRGFGFVEFDDPAQAKAAIAGTHGRDVNGRSLTVNEARAQGGGYGDRGGSRGSGDRGRGGFGGQRY